MGNFLNTYFPTIASLFGNMPTKMVPVPQGNPFEDLKQPAKIYPLSPKAKTTPAIKEADSIGVYAWVLNPNPVSLLTSLREQNEWVDLGVRQTAIACAASQPIFRITSSNKSDQRDIEEVTKILHNPNPYQESYSLFLETYEHLILYGNAYWQIIRTKDNGIHSIYPIHPEFIRLVPFYDKNLGLQIFYIQTNPETRLFSPDDIIHFKLPNTKSNLYGVSRVYSVMKTVIMDSNITELLSTFFESSFSGGFIFQQDANEQVANRNRQWLEDEYCGPQNAGRPMLLEGNIELKHTGNKFGSFDFGQMKGVPQAAILNALGIPLSMAGVRAIGGQANQEVIESEEDVFLRNIASIQKLVFDKIQHRMLNLLLGKPKWKIEAGINVKFSNRNSIATIEAASKIMVTINEARESLGLQPVDFGGDEYISLTNNGLIPTKNILGFDPNTGEETEILTDVSNTDTVSAPKTKIAGTEVDPSGFNSE